MARHIQNYQEQYTSSMLLSYALSSKLPPIKRLCCLPVIKNGLIIEFSKSKDNHARCISSMIQSWIRDLYGRRWSQQSPTVQAIVNSADRLIDKYKRLQKQHSSVKKRWK